MVTATVAVIVTVTITVTFLVTANVTVTVTTRGRPSPRTMCHVYMNHDSFITGQPVNRFYQSGSELDGYNP